MPTLLADLSILVFGLLLLTAGAELLVAGAVRLAARMGLSSLVIGLTIVGFGTSTPELVSSLVAAGRGNPDVAIGNVVGSNIFNVALILGATALLRPFAVSLARVRGDVLMTIAVAFVPWLALLTGQELGRGTGSILLLILLAYLYRSYRAGKAAGADEAGAPSKMRPVLLDILFILAGLGLLIYGADRLVTSSIALAHRFGVSDLVIGLTIVAGGTSMPELMTSLVAARRGQSDIALGNVLGSNVFNILGILGVTAVVQPQRVHDQILLWDAPVMLASALGLFACIGLARGLGRAAGASFVSAYGAYLAVLIWWAPGWFG